MVATAGCVTRTAGSAGTGGKATWVWDDLDGSFGVGGVRCVIAVVDTIKGVGSTDTQIYRYWPGGEVKICGMDVAFSNELVGLRGSCYLEWGGTL